MLLFLVWVFHVLFGVDFGFYSVVPVCLALLQLPFGCPVRLTFCLLAWIPHVLFFFVKLFALFKKWFLFLRHCCSVAFHFHVFQIWWSFKHTTHFSMGLPFFFFFLHPATTSFPPPYFNIFNVEHVWHFFATPLVHALCVFSVSICCVWFFMFIPIHVCAWFGCVVHVLAPRQCLVCFGAYLVLVFAGFLCVAFFSSVGW